ncbi:hypothetical protein MBLNU459_g5901t1 [Dothideomycetes sp. NU459]
MVVQLSPHESRPDSVLRSVSLAQLRQLRKESCNAIHPLLRGESPIYDPLNPLFPASVCLDLSYTQNPGRKDTPSSDQAPLLLFGANSDSNLVCPYPGFDDDPSLWDPDGDAVIFVNGEPFLRIDARRIYDSNHGWLINALEELSSDDRAECSTNLGGSVEYIIDLISGNQDHEGVAEYCLALRNFFAVLDEQGIVGLNLVSALTGVQTISESFLGIDSSLTRSRIFIQWEKGYVETFTHCVGMMGYGGFDVDAFLGLTKHTKELLNKSWYKQHQTIQAVEQVICDFDIVGFNEKSNSDDNCALQATNEFRRFLLEHYIKQYGQWPPRAINEGGQWLTRTVAQQLQDDFGTLYDLLVDDTLTWQEANEETGTTGRLCKVDIHETAVPVVDIETVHSSRFALQDVIAKWNHKCDLSGLPLPFPRMPKFGDTCCTPLTAIAMNKASLVPALRGQGSEAEHQKSLRNAYSHAYNGLVNLITPPTSDEKEHNADPLLKLKPFAKAFILHELDTHIEGTNTHDARLGRWLVIHCMMQLLSHVAVDNQGLHYRNDVPYFLNASLKGCPPWPGANFPATMREATVTDSWAWIYARSVAEEERANGGDGE